MSKKSILNGILTGNQLKILAVIFMTIDHIGAYLLPQYGILRIIGRLSLPIFAYMIAEGCHYTKNRLRYLLTVAGVALICQVVYFFAMGSLRQCILVTFTLSILLIYAYDSFSSRILSVLAFFGVFFVTTLLKNFLPGTDFHIDYGFAGVMLPLFIYIGNSRAQKLQLAAFGLIFLAMSLGGIQWYATLALPILALYGGKRGRYNMKNFFYIYYPVHLAVIYLIDIILKRIA